MLVSYNWLRELLPALTASPQEVAERLSAAGIAVDGLVERGVALREVRVARVTAIAPHPKRSGLRHASDLADAEWDLARQSLLISSPAAAGHPARTPPVASLAA